MLRFTPLMLMLVPAAAFAQQVGVVEDAPTLAPIAHPDEPVGALGTGPAGPANSIKALVTAERSFPIPSPLPSTAALPGDEELDCGTLYAESKYRLRQNSEINEAALAKPYVKGGETKALEALGNVGGMIPVLGGLVSLESAAAQVATTKKDAEQNYGESTRQADWVLDRMVHVSDLYRTKCLRGSPR